MDKRERSFKMATRLKELREENALSFSALKQKLEAEFGVKISTDSLINYEISDNHRSRAQDLPNMKMKTEYLIALSELYGVSTDYLIGSSDYRGIPANESSVESIGLPEEFVNEYLYLKNKENFGVGPLNKFLTHPAFWESMSMLYAVEALPSIKPNPNISNEEIRELRRVVDHVTEGTMTIANIGYIVSGASHEAQELFLTAFAQSTKHGKKEIFTHRFDVKK